MQQRFYNENEMTSKTKTIQYQSANKTIIEELCKVCLGKSTKFNYQFNASKCITTYNDAVTWIRANECLAVRVCV